MDDFDLQHEGVYSMIGAGEFLVMSRRREKQHPQ